MESRVALGPELSLTGATGYAFEVIRKSSSDGVNIAYEAGRSIERDLNQGKSSDQASTQLSAQR